MSMRRGILFSVTFGIAALGLIGFSGIFEPQAFAGTSQKLNTEHVSEDTTYPFKNKILDDDDFLVIDPNVTFTIEEGVLITNYGMIHMHEGSTIINNGKITNNGSILMYGDTTIINNGVIKNSQDRINLRESAVIENNGEIYNHARFAIGGTIDNSGIITNYGILSHSFEDGSGKNLGSIINSGTINNERELNIGEKGLKNKITSTITNIAGATITLSHGGLFDNAGTISNVFGTIQNDESIIYNAGTIDNFGGTIHNIDGKLTNAHTLNNIGTLTVSNGGSVSNILDATLTNIGTIEISKSDSFGNKVGSFDNQGKIINKGTFDNGGVGWSSGVFNNKGLLNNAGAFNNDGILANFCGGVIKGLNPILRYPVVDACFFDKSLEIVPESVKNPEYDDGNKLNDPFTKFNDPFSTEEPELTCGPGFEPVNGICQVITSEEPDPLLLSLPESILFLKTWGTKGDAPSQFSSPVGIAVDSSGNVYVAESDNNRIQKFSETGAFLTMWGTKGDGPGQFSSPVGIAVD